MCETIRGVVIFIIWVNGNRSELTSVVWQSSSITIRAAGCLRRGAACCRCSWYARSYISEHVLFPGIIPTCDSQICPVHQCRSLQRQRPNKCTNYFSNKYANIRLLSYSYHRYKFLRRHFAERLDPLSGTELLKTIITTFFNIWQLIEVLNE